jgi:phospholipid transport system transporter-binding protein
MNMIQKTTEQYAWRLQGELTFNTARDLYRQSLQHWNQAPTLEIDLREVHSADSAGLALLIEWQRNARQHQQTLTFLNIPAALTKLAKISQLDEILHFQSA